MALRLGRPLKLQDVKELFDCGYQYARERLTKLEHLGWLTPEGKGGKRTHFWRVNAEQKHIWL